MFSRLRRACSRQHTFRLPQTALNANSHGAKGLRKSSPCLHASGGVCSVSQHSTDGLQRYGRPVCCSGGKATATEFGSACNLYLGSCIATAQLPQTAAMAFSLCYTTTALRQPCIHGATVCLSMPFAVQANGPANPSCGFGPLSLSSFPFGKAASINANSPFLEGLPQGGCGLCFQLTCEAGVSIPT